MRIGDIARLKKGFGEELLLAFLQAFVHENRLLTFAHYRDRLRQALPGPVSLQRSKMTMLWYEVGTLFELGKVLGDLKALIIAFKWADAPGFSAICAREGECRQLRWHRNRAGFHVDPGILSRGLSRLPPGPTILAAGDASPHYESSFSMADEALTQGMFDLQGPADDLVQTVIGHRGVGLTALLELFIECIQRVGLTVEGPVRLEPHGEKHND